MHVDGFRFDLASVLGREKTGFQKSSSFFDAISQDPVLTRVKLIAEPWDLGTYEIGNFPVDWSEWNGKFRDTMRKFGKGDAGQVRDLGWRLTGSADLYADDGRAPYNSINFITCHDGFTMNDLVSYNEKHNEANLEENRDGSNDNNSWNFGVEGVTDGPEIIKLRRQLVKNFFCYLVFSSGTPMILGGDEFMRTQNGNNNAYCQDNETSWFNWNMAKQNSGMIDFLKKCLNLTKDYTVLQNRRFFTHGTPKDGLNITWYDKKGTEPDWFDIENRTLCFKLDGHANGTACIPGYYLFFILNGSHESQWVTLPNIDSGKKWYRIIDTSLEHGLDFVNHGKEPLVNPPEFYIANPRTTVVLVGK
jgi:glycogen operon protein